VVNWFKLFIQHSEEAFQDCSFHCFLRSIHIFSEIVILSSTSPLLSFFIQCVVAFLFETPTLLRMVEHVCGAGVIGNGACDEGSCVAANVGVATPNIYSDPSRASK